MKFRDLADTVIQIWSDRTDGRDVNEPAVIIALEHGIAEACAKVERETLERAAKICDGLAGDDSTFDRWTRKGAGQSAFAIRQAIQVGSAAHAGAEQREGSADAPSAPEGEKGTGAELRAPIVNAERCGPSPTSKLGKEGDK